MALLSISTQKAKDSTFVVLFGLYIVASMTWAFKADSASLGVELFIRVFVPISFLVAYRKFKPPTKGQLVLGVYLCLTIYMFGVAAFSEAPMLVVLNTAKFLYPVFFFATLVLVLHPHNFSLQFLNAIPILGLLASLQTLTLAALIYSGHSPLLKEVTLVGYKNFEMPSFGMFGYAWGSIALGTPYQVYRAQSFFGEPTRMASFMEVVTIVSWGLYRLRKRAWMLAASALAFVTGIMCFSMTADVVAFLTIIFYFAVTRWNRMRYFAPIAVSVLMAMSVIAVVAYLNTATAFYDRELTTTNLAVGHADTEVSARMRFVVDSLRLVLDHPFGLGVIGIEDSKVLSEYPDAGHVIAPFEWTTKGGIVALVLQLFLLLYLMRTIIIRQVREGGLQRYVALALVLLILHHCVAGEWMDTLFVFLIAAAIALDRYNFAVSAGESACEVWFRVPIIQAKRVDA